MNPILTEPGRVTLVLLCLLVSSMLPVLATESASKSASEIDWQPAATLSVADRNTLPDYCYGRYLDSRQSPSARLNLTKPGLIHVSADEAQHIVNQSTTLIGRVKIFQGHREIKSPRVIQDETTQTAVIAGPMQLREPGMLVTGEHGKLNLVTGTGNIQQATFLLHEAHFRGSADHLERVPNGHLQLDNTTFTRCEPGNHTWALNSKHLDLSPDDGWGIAKHTTLRIEGVPVAYLPYLRFPINDKRQSGFLFPGLGYDSTGGVDIALPYYFNLAPHYDLTYEPRSLWQHGLIHNTQFRFKNRHSDNEINAAFIRRDDRFDVRSLFDSTSANINTGIATLPFNKQDRWFLNLRHEGAWGAHWQSSIDYTAISDLEYLQDIGGNIRSSVTQFLNPIDSTLTDQRTAALDRLGQIKYRHGNWQVELRAQGFQNLDRSAIPQYQKLPEVTANWAATWGPTDLQMDLAYTSFIIDNTDLQEPLAIVGERAYANLSWALPYQNLWGFLTPTLGVIHRQYQLDDTAANVRTNPVETTGRFSFDSGLYFDRLFTWFNQPMQQTLEPRLYYLYVEHDGQDDLPQFDAVNPTQSFSSLFRDNRFSGFDRIGDAQQISLGITSRLLHAATGSELFSMSLGQIYYFKDRRVIFQPVAAVDPSANQSAIFTQARLRLDNGLAAFGSYQWEPDVGRSNRGTLTLKYSDHDRKIFNLNYTYVAPEIQRSSLNRNAEETDVNFIWPLSTHWSAIGRWNFGWDDGRTIESFFGLEYNDCCWKSRLVWRRFLKIPETVTVLVDDPTSNTGFRQVTSAITPHDVGIFFEFQLKGISTLGNQLDTFLESRIPGYRERENIIGQ